MEQELTDSIIHKIEFLNRQRQAVIFIITGANGSGKTIFTKQLLTSLPFHQTFNLGAVAKTIRFTHKNEEVTRLENFTNDKVTSLFTPIVQFACTEYRSNGVNVIIEGVQIDTKSAGWEGLITGGVILSVDKVIRLKRNKNPETHFNRVMELSLTDNLSYKDSNIFETVDNNMGKEDAFSAILTSLSEKLDAQISSAVSLSVHKEKGLE